MSMSRKIAIGKGWQLKDGKLVPCYSAVLSRMPDALFPGFARSKGPDG